MKVKLNFQTVGEVLVVIINFFVFFIIPLRLGWFCLEGGYQTAQQRSRVRPSHPAVLGSNLQDMLPDFCCWLRIDWRLTPQKVLSLKVELRVTLTAYRRRRA